MRKAVLKIILSSHQVMLILFYLYNDALDYYVSRFNLAVFALCIYTLSCNYD